MLRFRPRFICERKVSRRSPCRDESGRDFLLHTAKSGAPNLRSGEDRPNIAQGVRPHPNPPPEGEGIILRWLHRYPALSGSPVLLRLAGGAIPLFAAGIVLVIIAAALGPYTIPFSHTADILLEQLGIGQAAVPGTEEAIVASVRLPRIALALVVGAALGVAGAVMQGLFRNPMADPGIIGVSTGGALGAVVAIATGAQAAFALALPAMSFAGATGALVLVFRRGLRWRAVLHVGPAAVGRGGERLHRGHHLRHHPVHTRTWKRSGICSSGWAGGLDASRWSDVRLSLPFVLFGVAVAVFMARDLNLLMVSDDEARALGVRVNLTRNSLLLAASLITGAAVAFSGTIAFVGLIVPHALRLVTGADHRVLVPLSALGGGVFMLAADTRGPAGHIPGRGQRGNHHCPGGRPLLPDAAGPQQGAGFDAVNPELTWMDRMNRIGLVFNCVSSILIQTMRINEK